MHVLDAERRTICLKPDEGMMLRIEVDDYGPLIAGEVELKLFSWVRVIPGNLTWLQ